MRHLRGTQAMFDKANKYLVFTFIVLLGSQLNADSFSMDRYIDPLMIDRTQPWSRIDAQIHFQELDRHKYYERYRSITISGEYAFTDWFSIAVNIPYTEQTRTDTNRVKYIDHISTGARFAFGWEYFLITAGLEIEFSRGHTKAGDVPSDVGYIMPYAGFLLFLNSFYVQATIQWETQTNPRFVEDYGQQFDRTWIVQGMVGYRYDSFRFSAELEYRDRYDPEQRIFKTLLAGPSVGYDISESMTVAAGALFAIQDEREEDLIFRTRFTYRY